MAKKKTRSKTSKKTRKKRIPPDPAKPVFVRGQKLAKRRKASVVPEHCRPKGCTKTLAVRQKSYWRAERRTKAEVEAEKTKKVQQRLKKRTIIEDRKRRIKQGLPAIPEKSKKKTTKKRKTNNPKKKRTKSSSSKKRS